MNHRIIISGGGTGGHIFPAIAIANALRRIDPTVEILFVGAQGRMEMDRVPAAGYQIKGLDIQGINRQSLFKNLLLPFKMLSSLWTSRQILKQFKAEIAVGVGGFASGPLLMAANMIGIPTLIQEQNSYAGVTNKRLGGKAKKICVAYEGMGRFFAQDKILFTGNPIRRASVEITGKREEALNFFGLNNAKKTILVTGGSLGANTLNLCVRQALTKLRGADVQVIWQCGGYYADSLKAELNDELPNNVKLYPFLDRMDYAYAAADIVVSRAGAATISELCVVGKPVVLVPSPNVAEDHQTKNADALVKKNAAILVKDSDAKSSLIATVLSTLKDPDKCDLLGHEIKKMAKVDADDVIANEVLKLIR